MEVVQVIKKLNNTELGKGGTHESYIQVPQELEISDIFPEANMVKNFIYKQTKDIYNIRLTVSREKRIVGLGDFYRNNEICAGDEVVLEKHTTEKETIYYIDLNKRQDVLMIQKCKSGFELLNAERKHIIKPTTKVYINGDFKNITIGLIGSEKKRVDSPSTTDIYEVKLGEDSLTKNYNSREMTEIRINIQDDMAFINQTCAWKKYFFSMEEQND